MFNQWSIIIILSGPTTVFVVYITAIVKINSGMTTEQFSQPLTDERLSFYFYEGSPADWILLYCMNNAIEMV